MKIGDVVYNEWHGIRRYGVVQSLSVKEEGLNVPWAYARVKWFDDEPYEKVVENTNLLRNDGTDIYKDEYRIDKITNINLDREVSTLTKIKEYIELEELY
tara:strand:- start:5229 stop:5528 length:300 start_codon:yes stop_codon:yes gene_type:complete